MEGNLRLELCFALRFLDQLERWGALRMVNNGQNGQEHSTMVQNGLLERLAMGGSLEVLRGSLEVLRDGLWRSSEGAWGLLGRS